MLRLTHKKLISQLTAKWEDARCCYPAKSVARSFHTIVRSYRASLMADWERWQRKNCGSPNRQSLSAFMHLHAAAHAAHAALHWKLIAALPPRCRRASSTAEYFDFVRKNTFCSPLPKCVGVCVCAGGVQHCARLFYDKLTYYPFRSLFLLSWLKFAISTRQLHGRTLAGSGLRASW